MVLEFNKFLGEKNIYKIKELNMQQSLQYIVDKISAKDPLHSKKVKKNLKKLDQEYTDRANIFLGRYIEMLEQDGKTLDFAIDSYLKMIADVNHESLHFLETGEYTSKSFDEVNSRVYNNPEVMAYYMHALLLSQFLWKQHYDILIYFNKVVKDNSDQILNYMEVGGGHGLYISEAINIKGNNANYDVVDISSTSLDIAKKLIKNDSVNFILSDIYDYRPEKKYDFITMGEVMEHVEDPVSLLKQLKRLLKEKGKLFITTPTNAPAIDHIYLFRNADEIREVIKDAGFSIESEISIYTEDLPEELLEKYKISLMYGALLTKTK
jgi:2-polyprenyl-3-methyl-5-hydroxy-6-metoxy-1,4-benzoquinol methylase